MFSLPLHGSSLQLTECLVSSVQQCPAVSRRPIKSQCSHCLPLVTAPTLLPPAAALTRVQAVTGDTRRGRGRIRCFTGACGAKWIGDSLLSCVVCVYFEECCGRERLSLQVVPAPPPPDPGPMLTYLVHQVFPKTTQTKPRPELPQPQVFHHKIVNHPTERRMMDLCGQTQAWVVTI